MKYKFHLLFIVLYSLTGFSQTNSSVLYDDISYKSFKNQDSVSIDSVFKTYDNGTFTKEKDFKIYKKLGNKTWYFHFPIKNPSSDFLYLTHSYSYLSHGKTYIRTNDSISKLHKVSYYKEHPFKFFFYRHPTWKIPINNGSDVLLELRNNGGTTRLEFHLETENEFLKRVENEYLLFGFYTAILISLIIILLYFSILKKEYSVIFYVIYICLMLVEFLGGKGLGIQYLWSDSSFLTHSARSFSQTLGTFFIGLFYLNFYQLKNNDRYHKLIFKIGITITVPLIIIYIYKAFFGGLESFYLYVWIILKVIALSWLINHILLAKNKKIPAYLLIAFMLPIVAIVIVQAIRPTANSNPILFYTSANTYYVSLIIEILIFTRFIFSSVIQTQQKYFNLKKISDELQYNFQNKALEIQHTERNKLLSNVHDSFGGYLEALKLRLLQKSDKTPGKVQEILDEFYKEYRYLLNSLYSPTINSDNFIENLIEFCTKINKISNNIIQHNLSLADSKLSQEKCVHLYRIISEIVTNAIKYAHASSINLNISKQNNIINLEVTDNGIGFDIDKIDINSYGLKNIKNRVETMNGIVDIISQKNKGTKIVIKIPEDE